MDTIDLLGSTLGIGFVSGIRLYATILALGLAIHFTIFLAVFARLAPKVFRALSMPVAAFRKLTRGTHQDTLPAKTPL